MHDSAMISAIIDNNDMEVEKEGRCLEMGVKVLRNQNNLKLRRLERELELLRVPHDILSSSSIFA